MKKYIYLKDDKFENLHIQGQRNAKSYVKEILKTQGVRATEKAIKDFINQPNLRFLPYGELIFLIVEDEKTYVELFDNKLLYENGRVTLDVYYYNELSDEVKEIAFEKDLESKKRFFPHAVIEKDKAIQSYLSYKDFFMADGTHIHTDPRETTKRLVYIKERVYELKNPLKKDLK